ncbi:MAG: hypothetical protein DRJ01_18210 [Bacteroidetes bacterium]|nr:MAG: hypothetical protein DRJ01_18210 [Bacteroidota bacterium]
MKIKVIIDLKNTTKKDLEELAKEEEINGDWKVFIGREIEIGGLDCMLYNYGIDSQIVDVREVE